MKERKLDAPVSVKWSYAKFIDFLFCVKNFLISKSLINFSFLFCLQFSGLRKIILTIYLVIVIIFVVVLVLIVVFAPIQDAIDSLKSMSEN